MSKDAIRSDASQVVQMALSANLAEVTERVRLRIVETVTALLEDRTREERERCVAVCRSRAELWRKTALARSPLPSAREEARARANEAVYLADLLWSGVETAGTTGGDEADA